MAKLGALVVVVVVMCAMALLVQAARPTPDIARRGDRVLVVVGRGLEESAFSTFIGQLRADKFEVKVASATDTKLKIASYNEYIYDHIILLSGGDAQIGDNLDASTFVDFMNKGGNLIVAGGQSGNDLVRELASQCGVEYDAAGAKIIDHFHSLPQLDGGKATTVYTSNYLKNPFVFPQPINNPIVCEGPAVAAGTDLAFEIVHGESTSYAGTLGKPLAGTPFAIGKLVGVVVAVQALNNARAVFTGHASLFSDRFFDAGLPGGKTSGNANLAKAVSLWAFQRNGVLRISHPFHHRAGDNKSLSWYRIKDDMVYEVDIEQRSGNQWVPYLADDVQMEAIMLDPYLRVPLKHDNQGNYTAEFKLPDVYGMFTLRVKYMRRGVSHLEISDIISVRPFRHNEYERFIQAAYPYYTSAFAMIFGVIAFSFVFLYHRDAPRKVKTN